MAAFQGHWMADSTENFDEFMEEMKVAPSVRQAIAKSKLQSVISIKAQGKGFKVRHDDYNPREYVFESQKEHTDMLFGKQVKLLTTQEGPTKFVHVGSLDNAEVRIVRELQDSLMVITITSTAAKHKLVLTYRKY